MRMRKLLAAGLAVVMTAGLLPAALAAPATVHNEDAKVYSGGIRLNKTAGDLNSSNETVISLSVEAPVRSTPVAVEFVLDATSSLFSSGDTTLIQQWAQEIQDTMADKNVSVGVTVFGNTAETLYPMSPLTSDSSFDLDPVDVLLWSTTQSGTNVQAGIRTGLADLNTATADPSNRVLVLITDGGSFWRLDNSGSAVNDTYNGTALGNADAAELAIRGQGSELASSFDALMQADNMQSGAVAYTSTAVEPLSDVLDQIVAAGAYTNFEKGIYYAAQELDRAADSVKVVTVGYPYYADDADMASLTTLARGFYDYAAGLGTGFWCDSLEETSSRLGEIMDTIYGEAVDVVIPKGSVITDQIGEGTSPFAYDFDVVTDQQFTLYVEGYGAMSATLDANNQITFQDGSTLVYTPGDNGQQEQFTLTLGQDITRSQHVELTYTAKLASREASEGDFVLYPNVSAWLTRANQPDEQLLFPAPYFNLSLTDGGDGGNSGGGGGDIDITDPDVPLGPLPDLNTDDHFAYIIGRDDGLVHPLAEINRAEVATIFFRMLTDDSRSSLWSSENPYQDVDASAWYNNAVSTLTNGSIITGKPGNVFDPNASITRAEFATIAVRFFGGSYDGEDQFSDIAGHWANQYINRAAVLGLINGRGDGTFDPDAPITRAEAMAIVNRTLGRKPVADHLLSDMITWPDNQDTSTWYYADVQEATNSHDFEVIEVNGEQVESWTELLPVRDWAALEHEWSSANSSTNPGDVMPEVTPDTAA
ncbi:S-layer homology domain-containing protein [Flavonifractor hominis]|uniref:S-layer homology domain-containing protein n=1 Tax=Flavonifractor hominis TaxID=3133178 RepID=A0ABV1EMK7_9FIRM